MSKKIFELTSIKHIKRAKRDLNSFSGLELAHEIHQWALVAGSKENIRHVVDLEYNAHRVKGAFHPSSAYHPCDMKLFLDLAGGRSVSKTTVREQGIYDIGTAVHGMMQYYYETFAERHDFDYSAEVGFIPDESYLDQDPEAIYNATTKKYRIAGHTDGVFHRTMVVNGRKYRVKMIMEYKTISSSGFSKLVKPHANYVKQATMYMRAFDAPMALILYINKEDGRKAGYIVWYTPTIWDPIGNRLLRIAEAVDAFEEPKKTESSSLCKRCGYLEDCQPNLPSTSAGAPPKLGRRKGRARSH